MLGAMALTVVLARPNLASADDPTLERARKVNLAYAANMPSYVADETAKRYTRSSASRKWQYQDTIQTEITINGSRAVRRQIRRNGKPWEQQFEALPGFKWYGGFGTEIRPVFAPGCSTTLEYDGVASIHGRRLLKYRFASPAEGCFAFLYFDNQQSSPPRTGHVFIDDATGNVMQFDEEATELPVDFGLKQRNEEVSWASVTIGEADHLLPVSANFLICYASGARARIEVEYKNHRHFEASSNIAFPTIKP
jgi:hypothetical protein